MRPQYLALILILLVPQPSWSQEAAASGLKGPVYSVFAEDFGDDNGDVNKSRGSTYVMYDRQGYELEIFRYKPDGSPWVHTILTRNGDKVFRSQTIGSSPFENQTVENIFDAKGRNVETDVYNGDGVLTKKSAGEFLENRQDSSTHRWRETNADGTGNTGEDIESTDPKTGISRQVATMNGKAKSDWVIQKDGNKIVFPDGSYSETERTPDGSTLEDRYQASTQSHTYQKSDVKNHIVEVIEKSDSSFIRCTYSFDESGRPSGQINYDRSGSIVDKTTTEYVEDSFGNWIEQTTFLWDTKSELPKPKITVRTFRMINYYQ